MGYTEFDEQRWLTEPNKSVSRTEFARDRARLMHSAALRRLAAKTQVMEAGRDDFPRTRLTHSLECAQVGREIAGALGADPDVVDAACLAHDLGHPPFGHNGERALAELTTDIGGFEGNAQTFRILTRLEPKAFSPIGGPRPNSAIGLNLTRAVLDAAAKYPWPRQPDSPKFGVYADDLDAFTWMRQGRGGEVCFEAQVMDWADDVSYCVHDIEDAIHGGHLAVGILDSATGRAEVIAIAQSWYDPNLDVEALDQTLIELAALLPRHYSGTQRDLANLKNLTSTLIGRFALAAQKATAAQYGGVALSRYEGNLIVPESARREVMALKALAARFVMNRQGAEAVYQRQRDQIAQVFTLLLEQPHRLDAFHFDLFESAPDAAAQKRVVVDQVASLTDVSLGHWLHRLTEPAS